MSPDVARLAIATGLSCTVTGAEGKTYTYPGTSGSGERTQVPVTLGFSQTQASIDARRQYGSSSAVLWNEETIDVVPYKKDGTGKYVRVGQILSDIIAGETDDGNFSGVLVPTSEAEAGDIFMIASLQDVETGQGSGLRETLSSSPCGAIDDNDDGNWEVWENGTLSGIPASLTVQTLRPPQAKPFPVVGTPAA